MINLSNEQQIFIQKAMDGKNVLVDACIGSGKTTAIQELCNALPAYKRILYLTYNRLLKLDAKDKIHNRNVLVQNYHGFAAYTLYRAGMRAANQSDLIQTFLRQQPPIAHYDVLIIDEYQDIEEELAKLLWRVKEKNPSIQIIAVGDMQQKIYDKTTLNVPAFMNRFLGEHYETLNFTRCFRLCAEHAKMLGRIWEKDIVGVNQGCQISHMKIEEVIKFLREQEPKDILCLGSRTNGDMVRVLNTLEMEYPQKFNKNTVYASIQEVDSAGKKATPDNSCAIFTTYDSSKGLERPICVVFDYTEDYWSVRLGQPQTSYEILRNIFCVAASRGKQKIIFVKGDTALLSEQTLSENSKPSENFKPMPISGMFDFKYREDIEECYGLLRITEMIQADHSEITINSSDGLIDLSPCIGEYQEFAFFHHYSIDDVLKKAFALQDMSYLFTEELEAKSTEEKILALTAFETKQKRYEQQVLVPYVQEAEKQQLQKRLAKHFSPDEKNIQLECEIPFARSEGELRGLTVTGRADVVLDGTVWELKFVSELSHEHALQCAMYMVAFGLEKGVLWNVMNNRMYAIRIPDKKKLMDAVARTITKHAYSGYFAPTDIDGTNIIECEKTSDKTMDSVTGSGDKAPHVSADIKKATKSGRKAASDTASSMEKVHVSALNDRSEYFAVIDTESNIHGELMSVGMVIADKRTFRPILKEYLMITPACNKAAMYSSALRYTGERGKEYDEVAGSETEALALLSLMLDTLNIRLLFAFNASADRRMLELSDTYTWCDIADVAVYRQYNPKIPPEMPVFSTGRLKKGGNVQGIMRLLTGSKSYRETHNALQDALDELNMMTLLQKPVEEYFAAVSK